MLHRFLPACQYLSLQILQMGNVYLRLCRSSSVVGITTCSFQYKRSRFWYGKVIARICCWRGITCICKSSTIGVGYYAPHLFYTFSMEISISIINNIRCAYSWIRHNCWTTAGNYGILVWLLGMAWWFLAALTKMPYIDWGTSKNSRLLTSGMANPTTISGICSCKDVTKLTFVPTVQKGVKSGPNNTRYIPLRWFYAILF